MLRRTLLLITSAAAALSLPTAPATAQTAAPHVLPDGSVPPGLRAVRQHMLDAPQNMLVFHSIESLFQTRPVARSGPVAPLTKADTALPAARIGGQTMTADAWEDRTFTNAFLVMRDGKILHESYRNNTDDRTHYISFSMAKSITAMLIGAAVADGSIKSIDQKATDYVSELKGSGYDGVTIRQLLQMRSGVDYEERYDFGNNPSTAAKIFLNAIVANTERFADTATKVGRKWAPGSHFNYSTLDTSVLGWILERATKQPLSEYTSRVLWQPMGMESYGFWMADGPAGTGRELNGMGYNATLRDFARLGQMMLDQGKFNGRQVLPADWVRQSTTITSNADAGAPPVPADVTSPFARAGYGFQVWTLDDTGAYMALGLQGQFIYVHPATRTVIVKLSYFPPEGSPDGDRALEETLAYFKTLVNWRN